MHHFVLFLSALVVSVGCGTADEPQGSSGASSAASTGMIDPNPDKGDPCTQDSDCGAPLAKCSKGNICTGSLDGDAFETECTSSQEADCAGNSCIEFPANAQNKTGICSMPCDVDEDCGSGAACISLGGANLYCLSVCTTDMDCANGFVCVDTPMAMGKACFVVPG
jgi:hypothetical protein